MTRGSVASIFTSATEASPFPGVSTHLPTFQDSATSDRPRRKSSLFSFSGSSSPTQELPFDAPRTHQIAQQFVPVSRPSRSSFDLERQLAFDTVNYRETLGLKVLLLSPWPTDTAPFVRQPITIYSYKGSVGVEIHRVSGADDHHFALSINAPEARRVSVSLPSSFQGQVCITGDQKMKKVHASRGFSRSVKNACIRLIRSPGTGVESEDALQIYTNGDVFIRLNGEVERQRRLPKLLSLTRLKKRFWNAPY